MLEDPRTREREEGCETRKSEEEDKIEEGKNEREKKKGKGRRKVPLLGPIKKPVSASVSESLLRHSRQLRKHLKAPEKPDNTSLLECRVPPGGHCDFAPCHRDTDLLVPEPLCVAISPLSYVLNIDRPPTLARRAAASQPAIIFQPAIPPFSTVLSIYVDIISRK